MAKKAQRIERIHCNNCGRETKHELKHQIKHEDTTHAYDADSRMLEVDTWWVLENELFECQGCEEVTLKRSGRSSELDPDSEVVTHFPPRVARQPPHWLSKVKDKNVAALLREVYAALQADSRRLAMMGCRAVLDRIMVIAVGDLGNFDKMLDEMVAQQLLSKPERDVLAAAIDAGSASAHRGYLPTPEALDHIVSIVEHAVEATLLPNVAKEIKRTTPRRPRRKA